MKALIQACKTYKRMLTICDGERFRNIKRERLGEIQKHRGRIENREFNKSEFVLVTDEATTVWRYHKYNIGITTRVTG